MQSSRVCISGASGVGKSTLLRRIERDNRFPDHYIAKGVIRNLIKQGIQINKGADHGSQQVILVTHYKLALQHPLLISDRCATDAFAYAAWDFARGNYSYDEHKRHEDIFLSCLGLYDYHFYLPPEFDIQADGVRDTDKTYQQEIHELFLTIYKKYSIKYHILTGTVEERFSKFNEIIK